jgi:CheY-like chemotaxis protein
MPETAAIPVVICSVLSQPSLALVLGAEEVLQKPIDEGDLLTTVQRVLAQAGSVR